MKKKVGILTFHNSNNNYGAVLQAFATYTVVNKLGFYPLIINLVPELTTKNKSYVAIKQRLLNILIHNPFAGFRKTNLPQITPRLNKYDELRQISDKIDYCIVGSDQVWRPKFTKENASHYFLDFVSDNCKRIAYAPSFGIDKWEASSELTATVRYLIHKFNAVSVREKSGVDICKNVFNISAKLVLDPTLLLLEEDYNKLIVQSKQISISHNYIASYFVNDKIWKQKLTDEIAVSNKLKNVDIFGKNKSFIIKNIFLFNSIPNWLNYIKNSNLVITDSYHCVIFSIIFKKKFIVLPNPWGGLSRLNDLLDKLGLIDRLITDKENYDISALINKDINYHEVDKHLNVLRLDSIYFLKESLGIDSNF